MATRIALGIEYDGSRFLGWQTQPGGGTVQDALEAALSHMGSSALPFAFVMEKDSVRDDGLDQAPPDPRPAGASADLRRHRLRPTRADILARFLDIVPQEAAVVATTGKCGRELFTLADREQHLYQVGSMGGASAGSLGVENTNLIGSILARETKTIGLAMVGNLLPLTHFLRILRGILLKGNGPPDILPNVSPILAFLLVVATVALLRYRETLD